MKFEHLTLNSGLSQSNVQTILRDTRGFMWFGTEDGLNRYDGYNFQIYRNNPDDSTSISSNYITKILEDKMGRLWIATLGGGLNIYDRKLDSFIRVSLPNNEKVGLNFQYINNFIMDQAGNLWIGFDSDGLAYYDLEHDTLIKYKYSDENYENCLSYDDVDALCEDSLGRIWIGTLGGGLDRFNPKSQQFTRYESDPDNPESIGSNEVTYIFEDSQKNIWLGTSGGGLNRYDARDDCFVRYMHDPDDSESIGDNVVFSIVEDRWGRLWIGTEESGLNLFDKKSGNFRSYSSNVFDPYSLNHNSVESLYNDEQGILWVGTYHGGVNYFNQSGDKFRLYRQTMDEKSLSNNAVVSFFEDHTGRIWIGTDGGGLNYFNQENEGFLHYMHHADDPRSLSHNAVLTIYEDNNHELWIGTYSGGLNRFNRKTQDFDQFKHREGDIHCLSDNDVRAIFEDKHDNFWIGTLSGLNLFDREKNTFKQYFHDGENPNSLGHDAVIRVFEDSRGNLWIGTYGGGLNLYDPENDGFIRYQYDEEKENCLSNDYVFSILEDSKKQLWIGTGSGLNRFNYEDQTFYTYYVKDGLPNDFISGILEDDKGYLWLSTHKGLSRFNPEIKEFRNYDSEDGLQGNDFSFGSYMKSSTGEMYFGGADGFTVFHPDEVTDNPFIPPIIITDFMISNKPVPIKTQTSPLQYHISETEELHLKYWHSVFSFEFTALNYILPKKNQYAYILEGFEEEWNQVGTKRTATYTNLDPGAYTFRVKGSNNDGIWNEDGTSINIIITPPFWQTAWFRIIVGIVILLFIYSIFYIRTVSIRNRNRVLKDINAKLNKNFKEKVQAEEKTRKSLDEKVVLLKEIHHRVKNNLQIISSLLYLQSKGIEDKETLKLFTDSQSRVKAMAFIHEKLYQSSDFAQIDFADYIQTLTTYLVRTYCLSGIRTRFEAESIFLDLDVAIPCGLIINELVMNALKHAFSQNAHPVTGEDPEIVVTLSRGSKQETVLTVRDNGCGVPEEIVFNNTETLGMKLISSLTKQIKGRVHIDRSKGTKVEIHFGESVNSQDTVNKSSYSNSISQV
ncbi:histidine kinase [candidate division KSB1 bacterium]|nr:histidine kinase [candidate division KSB1 bacterium]